MLVSAAVKQNEAGSWQDSCDRNGGGGNGSSTGGTGRSRGHRESTKPGSSTPSSRGAASSRSSSAEGETAPQGSPSVSVLGGSSSSSTSLRSQQHLYDPAAAAAAVAAAALPGASPLDVRPGLAARRALRTLRMYVTRLRVTKDNESKAEE